MKKILTIIIALGTLGIYTSCSDEKNSFDASGSFETEETIVSAEAAGVIKKLAIEEGEALKVGQVLGYIDSTQLYLKAKQIEAQMYSLESKTPDISLQLAALNEQLKTLYKEKNRITQLVKAEVATTKQLDDLNATIEVTKRQIEAQGSTLEISSQGIHKDAVPLALQIAQLNDQLKKCVIENPIEGVVLAKYAKANEITSIGKPLYKIANLSSLILRVYISGNQLPSLKLNQKVKVNTDNGKGGYNVTEGLVTWISDKAEFTPKTIQTKDERANLVYAVKVKVANDGTLKIGMYGEVSFK
jgi:HlyD family secretion protein